MPTIGDACPNCDRPLVACEPGGCVQCGSCGYHENDDSPLVEFEADSPFEFDPPEVLEDNPAPWNTGLRLPAGVSWSSVPDSTGWARLAFARLRDDNFPSVVAGVREWADENGLQVFPSMFMPVAISGVYAERPSVAYVGPLDLARAEFAAEWEQDFECPHCGGTHPAYTVRCSSTQEPIICSRCMFHRGSLREIEGEIVCDKCVRVCEYDGCEAILFEFHYCDDHRREVLCYNCESFHERSIDDEDDFIRDADGHPYCDMCAARLCPSCNRHSRQELTYSRDTDSYVCRRCFLGADESESFDEEAGLKHRQLVIPAIPGRENIRLCGVEIEGGNGTGGGDDLAMQLYDQGLSSADGVASYHSGSGLGFAHVERDSSVDWEAVLGPINPADQRDVTKLNQAVRTIRSMVKDGTLTLDLRAGCHIHVEAARTSLDGAFNLNTLFAFAEDVIFRLASARWPIHRAISDSHYTQPIPKEHRKVQFARAHAESDSARYYALSFNNYFSQMLNRCRCGATRYDSWEDCSCDLGKCTFEFRVFNTTANPRKLHAYLALTQALVAKAMSMEKVENPVAEFPAHAFVSRRFKDMGAFEQEEIVEEWRERLTWLFSELPLTNEEKESLAYCIRHSELEHVGEEFITDVLLPQQQVIEEVTA